jgi:hypothetical protein
MIPNLLSRWVASDFFGNGLVEGGDTYATLCYYVYTMTNFVSYSISLREEINQDSSHPWHGSESIDGRDTE